MSQEKITLSRSSLENFTKTGMTGPQLKKLLEFVTSPAYVSLMEAESHKSVSVVEPVKDLQVPVRRKFPLPPVSEEPFIGIGITTYKRPDMILRCLAEFKKYMPPNCKITVNDDSEREEGIARAKNRCIADLEWCDYIFLFDDDCWPCAEKWWEFFINSAIKYDCHFVSPYWDPVAVNKNHNGLLEQKWVSGQCLFFTKEHVALCGGMNSAFLKYGGEHEEYARRSYLNGLTPFPLCDFQGSFDLLFAVDRYTAFTLTTTSESDLRNDKRQILRAFDRLGPSWRPFTREPITVTWANAEVSPELLSKWTMKQDRRCLVVHTDFPPERQVYIPGCVYVKQTWLEFLEYVHLHRDYIEDITFKAHECGDSSGPYTGDSATVSVFPYNASDLQCVRRFGTNPGSRSARSPAVFHLPKPVWERHMNELFLSLSHPMNETGMLTAINMLPLDDVVEIDTRPVLLILGCQKYMETLRLAIARSLRPTWHVVGVVGGATETSFSDNILHLAVSDLYDDLPKKVYEAYKWAVGNYPQCVGIFKTDEDIYLHDPATFEYLVVKNHTHPYWGFNVEKTEKGIIKRERIEGRFADKTGEKTRPGAIYCWGAGYWISRSAIEYLIEFCKDDFYTQFLEDVCLGACLNRIGIAPKQFSVEYTEVNRNAFLEGRILPQKVL